MKDAKWGGTRPDHKGAPTGASFAQDLVRQTLSQHGLMPGGPAGAGPAAEAGAQSGGQSVGAPFMQMMRGFGAGALGEMMSQGAGGGARITLPEGAQFLEETYSCAAGSRAYRMYIPASIGAGAAQAVVMMLHGCTQTSEDFAIGTGMNAQAEAHGFVVIYPQQSRGDHAQSCWNWFSRGDQLRDRGEPAILAGLARQVIAQRGGAGGKACVAGLSAGGAMAVILGETYPDVFAAVGVHSGLPYEAAKDVGTAFAAMAGNPLERRGEVHAGGHAGPDAARVIVFHGTTDHTVSPVNGARIVRQALDRAPAQVLQEVEDGQAGGRAYHREITRDESGRAIIEQWRVEGLGHAWSGGQAGGTYTDTSGPDASAEMVRFFFDAH